MAGLKPDPVREHRIQMAVIVDACGGQEQPMGWYYYLDERLQCLLLAECVAGRAISPLRPKDEVEVSGMAPEDECGHEMFVMIRWERDGLAVPLSQLKPTHAEGQTQQAVDDWRYWAKMGYRF